MTIWRPKLSGSGPLYRRLAEAIAREIEGGVLPPGTRLPTQRAMADRLGVALTTVTRAYGEAEKAGLITSAVGRGTFVRDGAAAPAESVDLRGNSLLPQPLLAELRRTLARTAERAPADGALDYGPHGGSRRHRAAGVAFAGNVGVPAALEQVVVTAGAQHAMLVTLSALLVPGDTLLVEELTYTGMRSLARLLGLRLRPLAMDREGIRPSALRKALADGARALYVQPVLQNPTAAVMSEGRRDEIAGIARRAGLRVVEDDSYGFLLPEAPRLAAKLEDAFWLSSASKALLPALRVGFVRAPAELAPRLEAGIGATAYLASPLLAEVVANSLDEGLAARVFAWKRQEVTARQRLASQLLTGFTVETHPVSPHLWLHLPSPWTAREAVAAAAQHAIAIAPAEAFSVTEEPPRAVRLSLGPPTPQPTLAAALTRLAAMLRQSPGPAHVVA